MTATHLPPPVPNAEQAHTLFRGAAEVGKRFRLLAFVLELLAAAIATGEALVLFDWGGWTALAALGLLALAAVARAGARTIHGFSERSRRASVRALAAGSDIGADVLSGIVADAPPGAQWWGRRLPASNLEQYYEPRKPAGRDRLRELYAHSSFYSWRLLRFDSWGYLLLAVLTGLIGFIVVYGLVLDGSQEQEKGKLLGAVCSLVFAVLALRAAETALETFQSAGEIRLIADSLIVQVPDGALIELTSRYDVERASAPCPSTVPYLLRRGRLKAEWDLRRRALD